MKKINRVCVLFSNAHFNVSQFKEFLMHSPRHLKAFEIMDRKVTNEVRKSERKRYRIAEILTYRIGQFK